MFSALLLNGAVMSCVLVHKTVQGKCELRKFYFTECLWLSIPDARITRNKERWLIIFMMFLISSAICPDYEDHNYCFLTNFKVLQCAVVLLCGISKSKVRLCLNLLTCRGTISYPSHLFLIKYAEIRLVMLCFLDYLSV